MQVIIVGVDIARMKSRSTGLDVRGCALLRKRLRRSQLTDFFANLPPCLVDIESTRG